MKNVFILLLLFCINHLWGQSVVNRVTGTMSGSIPIYTLQEGSLTVPISLSYDGGGVAVDAMATSTGLNWRLNADGYISRAVRGTADEGLISVDRVGVFKGYLHQGYPTNRNFAFLKDWEPDIFTMVLSGQAVSFMLKKETIAGQTKIKAILLNDATDIDVQTVTDTKIADPVLSCANMPTYNYNFTTKLHNMAVDNGLSSFIVTTADGIRYYFGKTVAEREYAFTKKALEETGYFVKASTQNTSLACPTTWYLSNIEYPKGTDYVSSFQSINFTYGRSIQKFISTHYDKSFALSNASCNDLPKITYNGNDEAFIYKCDLKTIVSNNFDVKFNASTLSEPTNVATIIPDYQTGQFNDFIRGDLQPLSIPATFDLFFQRIKPEYESCYFDGSCSDCYNPNSGCYETCSKLIPHPIGAEVSKAINNIVIIDKQSQSKVGYYLHHDYFQEYYLQNATNNSSRLQTIKGRLNLRGVYPIKFNSNNTTELLEGYSMIYNGKTLPRTVSLARDHWGYHNGADINEVKQRLYNVPQATCTDAYTTNLTPSLSFCRIGSLASLKIPTGGIEYYDYELHDCNNYYTQQINGFSYVGGLRVKSIRHYEPISNNEMTTNYFYNKKNTTLSSGFLAICPFYMTGSYIEPSLYSSFSSRFMNGGYVTYANVKEETIGKKNGQTLNSGYIEYDFFTNEPNQVVCKMILGPSGWEPYCDLADGFTDRCFNSLSIIDSWLVYTPIPKYEFTRGQAKNVRVYSTTGTLQSETNYVYKVEDLTEMNGQKAGLYSAPFTLAIQQKGPIPQPLITGLSFVGSIAGFIPEANTQAFSEVMSVVTGFLSGINIIFGKLVDASTYTIYDYKAPISRIRLDKTISRSFDPSGANAQPIELTNQYFYESNTHKQLTKTQTRRSQNYDAVQLATLSEQQIKYSADYVLPTTSSDPAVQGLLGLQARKMLVPIEQISKRNGKVIGGSISQFYGTSGNEGLLQSAHSLELLQPLASLTLSSVSGGVFQKDANYKQQAQITGYNTRALPTAVSKTNEGASTSITYGVNGFMPTQVSYGTNGRAFTRSTEYAVPLFGASKSTSIDNSFTTANYDELGRIKEVKDHNGNMVKSYIYNYASTPAPNNLISLNFLRTISQPPINSDIINVTNGAIYSRASLMPNATASYTIKACATDSGVDAVETVLTGPKNGADTDVVNNTLLGGCGDITGLFFVNGNYTLEAKAYKNGVLVSWKKVSFTITN